MQSDGNVFPMLRVRPYNAVRVGVLCSFARALRRKESGGHRDSLNPEGGIQETIPKTIRQESFVNSQILLRHAVGWYSPIPRGGNRGLNRPSLRAGVGCLGGGGAGALRPERKQRT